MAQASSIEWTEATWNPVTGCTKISPGCKHCYAERMAERLQAMGQPHYRDGFELTLQPDVLELPLRWKTPRMIFVNSMSDLFHEDVPLEFIQRVFDVMQRAPRHTFQVLTKRPERAGGAGTATCRGATNIWMGTSVENADYASTASSTCRRSRRRVRFLSLEPLLGPIPRLPLDGHPLGHRRRRVRPRRPADGSRMGHADPRPCRRAACAVLLQAMGRREQIQDGPTTRRPDVG